MQVIQLPKGAWSFDPAARLGPDGGFGAVFRGAAPDGSPVAVKRLHLTAADAAHRELKIATEILSRSFDHVMQVLDAGEDPGSSQYFIVMPVATVSLSQHIDDHGPQPEPEALGILSEIAAGLAEVPEIVHRDLKPGNVLRYQDKWRIADFGIARFVEETTSARTLKDCLSPQYAAPEQWRSQRASPATDIYALGCLAYALLTGHPPFSGVGPALQSAHLGETPRPISTCGPQLQALLSMMLRKNPDARPSLDRVRTILGNIRKAAGPSSPALQRLAEAAAGHEREKAQSEAVESQARSAQQRRDLLANEARTTLKAIFERLAAEIKASVPTAIVERNTSSFRISIGLGSLEIDLGVSKGAIGPEAFPRSKWDVICGALIEVSQSQPPHKRAANLWYTRQAHRSADYRWFECAYRGNPLSTTGFSYEPAAVSIELADRAHWVAMDVITTAYPPVPIDDEDAVAFCHRWASILAAACEKRLKQLTGGLVSPDS